MYDAVYVKKCKKVLDRSCPAMLSYRHEIPSNILGIERKASLLKLSTKGRYGLRALVDLAKFSREEPVSISSIAARQDISERYLEQLMARLKKAGIVKSIRGASGGYVLAKPAQEISVGDVLRTLEGTLEPVECAAFHPDESCQAADSCVTKYVWKKINDSINQTVDSIMLDTLVQESLRIDTDSIHKEKACSRK